MTQEYLLTFLEHGVIDLGGDDNKLEKLRSTAKDLASALQNAPANTIRYTLVAADPNILSTDPTIEEAMQALRAQWTTVANAYKGGYPVAILRAILLEALVQSAREDDLIAVAFVNTARNALAYSECSSESPVWKAAVSEIETKVDARAESEWATPEMITVAPLRYTAPVPEELEQEIPVVDRADLTAKIHSAAGPWGSVAPANPQQPSQAQLWSQNFADRMGPAIADAIDKIAAELIPEPADLSAPLSALAKAVKSHVGKALASFSGATAGLQRRTNLLWWKEALYSPSAHESYLDLPAFEAAALMALDLHQQVPSYSPASVSAFLKEAIRCLPTNEEQEFLKLLHKARTADFMQPFRTLAADYSPSPDGRGPLLSLIGYPQSANIEDATTLSAFSGINPQHKLTPVDWGTYLFRELQSARAILGTTSVQTEKS